MVAEKVHIDSIKITEKYDEFVYFYSCPRAKLSPGFLSQILLHLQTKDYLL